jgi:hypothetical protein
MRIHVEAFAAAMEAKLKSKDVEKGTEGWLGTDCSVRYLLGRLIEEQRELQAAFDDCDPKNLAEECVDVANFAMMIRSRLTAEQRKCSGMRVG